MIKSGRVAPVWGMGELKNRVMGDLARLENVQRSLNSEVTWVGEGCKLAEGF